MVRSHADLNDVLDERIIMRSSSFFDRLWLPAILQPRARPIIAPRTAAKSAT